MKLQNLTATVITSLFVLFLASPAHGSDLIVDDDKLQCPAAQFLTIQSAVVAATAMPGTQKIRICAGTYAENVLIGPDADTRFEIFGDGAEKVFVTGVPGVTGLPLTPAIFDVLNVSGGVVIEKLTVDGKSALIGNPIGIRYQQTSGLLKDLAVLNVRDAAGVGQSVGIRINSSDGTPVNARVEDNLVQNWTRVGIMGNGPGVNIHVEDNLITGPELPKMHAPNGVQISRGAAALVKGNTVRNASIGIVPPNAGSGILLFCPAFTVVQGNKIFDSDTGVNLEDSAMAGVIGNEVSNSLFDAYPVLSGVAVFFGLTAPFPVGCPGGLQASDNNLIEGNKAFNNGRDAVHLEGFALQPGPSSNRIKNTDIKTSGRDGLRVVTGLGNRFVNNVMENSVEHDAHDDQMPTLNIWIDNICKSLNKENQPGLCKN